MTTSDRRACTLLAVLVLVVAVVAMHSVGAGHGTPAPAHPVIADGHTPVASSHPGVMDDQAVPAKTPLSHDCANGCLGLVDPAISHAVGAACLAVVSSLLALALALTLRSPAGSRRPPSTWVTSARSRRREAHPGQWHRHWPRSAYCGRERARHTRRCPNAAHTRPDHERADTHEPHPPHLAVPTALPAALTLAACGDDSTMRGHDMSTIYGCPTTSG